MKTFFNLVQDVQKKGFCHRCGGCVTFCTAVNYGALELDDDGKPRYGDMDKCIECGLCYAICPEIDELDEETKRHASWSAPMGRVMETTVAKSTDSHVLGKATDGGVVTSMLIHLFNTGRIDGAIVTRPSKSFTRKPWLAVSMEEMLDGAGFYYDTSHGMANFSDAYTGESAIDEFAPLVKKGLRRVALVGTPCQIHSFRRMELLGIVPSDSIKYCFGLFCSGNFSFGEAQREQLAREKGFNWDDVLKMNVKEDFRVHLNNGEVKSMPLEDLNFMKRYACRFCMDYSSEYADISFGGIGAEEGWTTVITRTPLGRAVFAEARKDNLVEFTTQDKANYATHALSTVRTASAAKKKAARQNLRDLGTTGVNVIG